MRIFAFLLENLSVRSPYDVRATAHLQHPHDGSLNPVTDQLGPRLRAEFEQLQKSERELLAAHTCQTRHGEAVRRRARWPHSPP